MGPFPFIEEIKNLESLNGFNDVVKVLNMVFSTVPWFIEPYREEIKYEDIEPLYNKFKHLKLGGWCGLNAEFFKWIIEGYRRINPNIRYRSYNYGLSKFLSIGKSPFYEGFTHIGVLVEIDKMEFFYDPYFGRYFVHTDGYPLQFKDLLYLISERKFDKYKSVFSTLKKPAVREEAVIEHLSPQSLMKEIFGFFEQQGLKNQLQNIFGTDNPDSLMLIKIPD